MTMAAHDWSSKALLSTSVFKAAGSLPGNTERALTIANNAYLRAEAVWKSWGIYSICTGGIKLTSSFNRHYF